MAANDTVTKLERWRQLLTAERDRRRGVDGDVLAGFLDQLAEMGKRLRAGFESFELTPAEVKGLDERLREFRERHRRD
jgi:hypothetical protein